MADARIKTEILAALDHPEAEDGLYFTNLTQLYEEEERPQVMGEDADILEALRELIQDGEVLTSTGEAGTIFMRRRDDGSF